ncbi:MAG: hypothetical protein ACI4S4_07930 [Candidatus Ornithospirochaeta sp.]
MNKKIVAIVLVVALALTSLAAASTTGTSKKDALSVGVGLGTNSGVAVKYGMGKFDLQGGLSFAVNGGNAALGIDCGAFYNFANWTFKTGTLSTPQTIAFTTGPIAMVKIKSGVGLDAIWAVGAEYTFPKVPVTMFLKAGIGYGFSFSESINAGLRGYGVLGALYNF